VWSAPSWNELRREAVACDEWNLLHPDEPQRVPYVTQCLEPAQGPVVAVTDFMRAVPDQIAKWVPQGMTTLGADTFGRSDTREVMRRFFHIDAESVTVAALTDLAKRGEVKHEAIAEALDRYDVRKYDHAPSVKTVDTE
jgi:pyruvate dehydrogenase E1 component